MRQAKGWLRLWPSPKGLFAIYGGGFPGPITSLKDVIFSCLSEEKAKLLRDVMAKIEAKNEVLE